MKRTLFLLIALFAMNAYGQQSCGFTQAQAKAEKANPKSKIAREKVEAKLRDTDIRSFLATKGATFNKENKYTGEIYEIPVVVHVIESSSGTTVTNTQIRNWIEDANKMYATTYGDNYYSEGSGADGGTVIPFKLVLAKRSPSCKATSGIVRYNGSTIAGYDEQGMNYGNTNGVSREQIQNLAPHWPESAYYNIYIVIGFDGDISNYGIMGFAYFPSSSDDYYGAFMKAAVVTKKGNATLAHEFGHSLGLYHPFKGASSKGGECPANNDCTTDNDKVCDTAPTQSLLYTHPAPDNNVTNPCTGDSYDGIQYNIMNYTDSTRKFTPGQRDRALAMFFSTRGELTSSLGATAPESNSSVTAASCSVTGVAHSAGGNRTYGIGPVKVVLGSINNSSSTINGSGSNAYEDYSSQYCLNSLLTTEIPKDEQSKLKVSITGVNSQTIKAWIDYNNNGSFEDNEVIVNDILVSGPGWGNTTERTYTFTPPSNAITNTNLRMRVAADLSRSVSPCGQYAYGQAEDYIIRLTGGLTSHNINTESDNYAVVYDKGNNTLNLHSSKESFGAYEVYNYSGQVIQKGIAKSNEIKLNNALPSGVYILRFIYKNEKVSKKFLK